jgi:menaquinol-cytochrome c reductase iron-sulfur subunit
MNVITRKLFTREGFLIMVTGFFSTVAGLAVGIPIVGYVLGALINQRANIFVDVRLVKPDGVSLGKVVTVDTIPVGQTEKVVFWNGDPLSWDGSTRKTASWLRRTGTRQFIAYSIFCTHLGCPIKWLADAQIFLCPCHGSVFNSDGSVAGGPAPRPLFTYKWRIDPKTNHIQIKTQHLPVI